MENLKLRKEQLISLISSLQNELDYVNEQINKENKLSISNAIENGIVPTKENIVQIKKKITG